MLSILNVRMGVDMLRVVGLGLVGAVAVCGAVVASSEVRAQDDITVTVTPRAWYAIQNDFYYTDNTVGQQTQDAQSYLFGGGTASFTFGSGPTLSITALYGEGSGDITYVSNTIVGQSLDGTVDVSRLDVEAILQFPLTSGSSVFVGGRYIKFERDERDNVLLFGVDTGADATFQLEQSFYLAELGLGVNQPIVDDGSVFAFGNLTAMLGIAKVDEFGAGGAVGVFNVTEDELEGGVVGVDTNVGVGVKLGESTSLSGRYRLFYLSAPDFDVEQGGTFIHGPEANLSVKF